MASNSTGPASTASGPDAAVEEAAPLILALRLDDASQARFDAERRAHFPPERNHLAAHVTVFHHLPGEALDAIDARLRLVAAGRPRFLLDVHDLWMMGRGVAYRLRSPELEALRAGLAAAWAAWLTPQDRQALRPHVTIQNKVAAADARALHARLQPGFQPFQAAATGLSLWHYRGGPWDKAADYTFPND